MDKLKELLKDYKEGKIDEEAIVDYVSLKPFEDLGFAKVDHHRRVRQGVPEVIFAEGKKAFQIRGILEEMIKSGDLPVLITRLSKKKAEKLKDLGIDYDEISRCATLGELPKEGDRTVLVFCAGTSDLPVAGEAAITARFMGAKVRSVSDVGISGIHRLLSFQEEINKADCIIAVAGMEGAMPSVIAGLARVPVIAVPTSVGYGASLGGMAALLSMLNSCANGVTVVNIDNGFGAGYSAALIVQER